MTRRWGILGTGGIAETFVRDLQGSQIAVSAVGSRDAGRARAFAAGLGIETAHGDYESLVADPAVDVVYVATPHVFHLEQALLAIGAGKHVLVEKPFTVNAGEAREIFAAAEAAGVIALEAMWTRFLPQNDRIREILRSEAFGRPRLFTGTHGQSLPTDPRHRINAPELGGGALLDLGVYPVSYALDVLGAPESVDATATLSAQGVDERVGVLLGHAGGSQSHLYAALDLAQSNSARIDLEGGRIELADTFFSAHGFTVLDSDGTVVERFERQEGVLRGMQHQAIELDRLARDGRSATDRLTPEATIAVMDTMDEIRRRIGVTYPGEVA
jgi:predicted dehydrogenase